MDVDRERRDRPACRGGLCQVEIGEATGLISRGKLHIPVEKSYPLAAAAAAHIDSRAGHTRGRQVMVI